MRTLRVALAWAVALVLVGGSSAVVMAQSEDSTATGVTAVTGTQECHMTTPGTTTTGTDRVERYRGHISTCESDTSDTRLNGPSEMLWETDCYPDGRCMMFGTTTSLGPDGWQGWFSGWIDSNGVSGVGVSTGLGSNGGLTAIGGFSGGDLSGNNTVDLLVYEGVPPPLPELIAALDQG